MYWYYWLYVVFWGAILLHYFMMSYKGSKITRSYQKKVNGLIKKSESYLYDIPKHND